MGWRLGIEEDFSARETLSVIAWLNKPAKLAAEV
jgi:hypothetical protein